MDPTETGYAIVGIGVITLLSIFPLRLIVHRFGLDPFLAMAPAVATGIAALFTGGIIVYISST